VTINVFQSQAQTTAQVVQRASSDLAKQLDAIAKLSAKAAEARSADSGQAAQGAASGKAASVGDIANASSNLLNQALQKSRATSGTGEVIGAFTTGSANFASGAAAKPAAGQAAAAPAAGQAAAAKPAGGQPTAFAFAGAIDVDKFNAAFGAATGTKANFTADQIKDGLNQFNRNQTTRSATLQSAANSAEVSRSGTAPSGSAAAGTTATATRDAQTGAAQVRIDFQGGSRTLDVAQFNKSLSQQTGSKANFTGEQIAQALNGDQKAVFGGAAGAGAGSAGTGAGANSGAAAKPAAPQQPAKLASETTLELLFAAQSSSNAASSKSGSTAYGAVAPQLSATQSQNKLLNLLT
jgi:hypothetical protein